MTGKKKAATLAARAGGYIDAATGGVVPAIQPSTTFVRDENYDPLVAENVYGRDNNEQVRLAEGILNNLEDAGDTLLFSSGMAAIAALFAWLKPGQSLLLQSGIYWGTTALARRLCGHREITLVEADAANIDSFETAINDHKPDMVFIETPSNPWLLTSDVSAIAGFAGKTGAMLAVDATAATPLLMQPLSLGADVVVHSATKALNGHSDVLAGVLSTSNADAEAWEFIKAERQQAGAILSAHDAWLLVRGLRTLPLRMERMCANAMAIANHLQGHGKVEAVWYPGLETHQGHAISKRQMPGGYGYLLSFLVKGGKQEALGFCRHLKGIHRATSLGGVETLVEHRYTIEGEMTGCPENLIRLSVGIEDCSDIIAELDDALSQM